MLTDNIRTMYIPHLQHPTPPALNPHLPVEQGASTEGAHHTFQPEAAGFQPAMPADEELADAAVRGQA